MLGWGRCRWKRLYRESLLRLSAPSAFSWVVPARHYADVQLNMLTWVLFVVGRYRYRLDVDGYGWSSRWQKLLSTNSVVLKSTIYVSSSPVTDTSPFPIAHGVVYTSFR